MKWIWKVFSSRHFLPLLVVIFFAVLAGRSLIFQPGYFNMHDDLQMMRQLQMEKCFLDGQIPCRWVPDMGYGFGFPLFNFYPPLPYLIGEIFRVLGASFVTTVKLNFALSILVSGVTMYLLAKDFFGRIGAVASSIFYIWAPYHAVDVYVRGAMNEAWALAWFPLIFWGGYKLVKSNKKELIKWIAILALSWFALLTSHNLMVLIFIPFFGLWILLHLWRENAWSRLPHLIISGIWALGLAAFFTIPALAENKFTQVTSQLEGYYDYTAHFVSLHQLLISRFWGYGPSVWVEAADRMSFQIGHIHWGMSLAVGLILVIRVIGEIRDFRKIKKDQLLLITALLLLFGWFGAFMTHLRSIQIYLTISYLRFIQFPWRFLSIVIFSFSFLVGGIPGIVANWKSSKRFLVKLLVTPHQILWVVVLVVVLLVLNWNYFKPEGGRMGPLTDEEKFSGDAWEFQQTAGIYDYLPIYAEMAPRAPQEAVVEIIEGDGEIIKPSQGTYWAKFDTNIDSETSVMRLGILQFPNWRVFVDGVEVETYVAADEKWGRIYFEIPAGEHLVYTQLFNTPIRTVSNLISLVSWVGLFSYPLWRRRLK